MTIKTLETRPPLNFPDLDAAVALAVDHHELMQKALKHFEDLEPGQKNILEAYVERPSITFRQANWIANTLAKIEEAEPLYGDFKAILVMFRIAGEHLQRPKIRLLTQENVFIQLTFIPESDLIVLHRGGWAGHGARRHIGWIEGNVMKPKYLGALDEDIRNCIQEFSLDPKNVALAMAKKLKACSFCGSRLSDEESKARGYGPVCAEHYALPWGNVDEAMRAKTTSIMQADDLSSLFT